jgi:hypothetical protein
MEDLIKKAFLHVDIVGPHVVEGHYDLIGPDNEIILPQAWERVIQPGWTIMMHMWPMPETEELNSSEGSATDKSEGVDDPGCWLPAGTLV